MHARYEPLQIRNVMNNQFIFKSPTDNWKPGMPLRLSTPFFLRGTEDTLLQPRLLSPSCPLPPLSVKRLDNNDNGCRDRMPWKINHQYYASMMYSQ
jgi:hypothetical protein